MTSASLAHAIEQFENPRRYLSVASMGLPPRATVEALTADLAAWVDGTHDPRAFDGVVERSRASYASIVGVDVERVAQGSQTSVLTSIVAADVPDGAEVLMPEGDFSSIQFPFVVLPGVRVRAVPLDELATSITDETWLVVFSLVQSATGVVADTDAILEAAERHGAFTFCDVTQAAGVLPVDASRFDVTVCHTYKWLCAPRGVAFLTLSERMDALLTPRHAGWYAGQEIWRSTYGPAMELASTARRFDVSPAWTSWVGAEPALALFAGLDIGEVWQRASGLGDALCDGLGIPRQGQAIVTWPDETGRDLDRLSAAGIRAAGRAGRLRASFHLFNDQSDVDAVVMALRA